MSTTDNDGQIIVIAPTNAALTSNPWTSKPYQWFAVSADNLTGTETVNIMVRIGTTLVQVVMPDLATPAKLTSILTGLPLLGGPTYVFVKSSTAGACGVYVDPLTMS